MPLPILTQVNTIQDFKNCLLNNPGIFIIKFGADWCGPCRRIEPIVQSYMSNAPENVQCAITNIDEAIELYGFLKNKRMLNGVPAILAYYKGNLHYVPNNGVIGDNIAQINGFFQQCFIEASK